MKKIFQMIGLISLTCFSFFVTEKTATVVNNMDEIMIEIKANLENYKSSAKDAIIIDNTIIPGINGKEVNINKSYKNMKLSGYYSDKLFIYDYTKPNVSLTDNIDKYIIKGNPDKRMVSLIFKVNSNDNIDDITKVINNYNIKSTFFVDYNWFTNNNDLVQNLVNEGHNIGILMDDYADSSFDWMDMVIKKINKQKNSFCYSSIDKIENITSCKLKNNYTVKPIEIDSNNLLSDIKQNLSSGSLFSFNINSKLKKELSTIIIYIKSKGYNLENLENHLLE